MVNFCASVSRKCSKKIITISWNYDCRVIDISLLFLQTLVITYIINYQNFPTVIYGWHLNFGYQISKIKSITCTIWTKFCYISSVCPLILANLSKLAASIVTKWSSFVPILIFYKITCNWTLKFKNSKILGNWYSLLSHLNIDPC